MSFRLAWIARHPGTSAAASALALAGVHPHVEGRPSGGPTRRARLHVGAVLVASTMTATCASGSFSDRGRASTIPASEIPAPARTSATATAASPAPNASASGRSTEVEGRVAGRPTETAGAGGPERGGVLGAADRGAESDFESARADFDRGDAIAARAALEGFVRLHPGHPSRTAADLMLARLALSRGEPTEARRILLPLVPGGEVAARYYLGLAEVRLGDLERGRQLLQPFYSESSSGGAAAELGFAPSDDAAVELRGALAEALAPTQPTAALDLWQAYFRAGRDAEKAWARRRASELAARLPPDAAWRAYGAAPPSGLQRAVLGARAAMYLRGRGDIPGASFVEAETSVARRDLGFDTATSRLGPGDPDRVGLAIPLSGKLQIVGEAALRAAMLAGGAPANPATRGGASASQLVVRDTGADADSAARGVGEMTRAEAVIGIVGAAGMKSGAAAVAQASQDGVALLSLDEAAPGALTSAFQVSHATEARATALARHALRLGVRQFAVLAPDHAGGRKLRDAFRKAVLEGGGALVAESTYAPGATSFASAIAPLERGPSFEAIFVPDSADRVALIAPALAVADVWPQPWTEKSAARAGAAARPSKNRSSARRRDGDRGADAPRPVLLLSTASDLSPRLLEQAGRYVQGALLCPGFFAAEDDPVTRAFVEAYRAAYGGRDPHAVEAYAYDAVATFRLLTQQGITTRADMIRALASHEGKSVLAGLTGNLAFGPDHGRVDAPIIYVVDGQNIRPLR